MLSSRHKTLCSLFHGGWGDVQSPGRWLLPPPLFQRGLPFFQSPATPAEVRVHGRAAPPQVTSVRDGETTRVPRA